MKWVWHIVFIYLNQWYQGYRKQIEGKHLFYNYWNSVLLFIVLQDNKERMKWWLLSTRDLSLENYTMTSLFLSFKAAMELNKDSIIQDELKQNQSSINEQSKCKQYVGILLKFPCIFTWWAVRWTTWKILSEVNSHRKMFGKLKRMWWLLHGLNVQSLKVMNLLLDGRPLGKLWKGKGRATRWPIPWHYHDMIILT